MSNDDFLNGLRAEWQGRLADPQALSGSIAAGEYALRRRKVQRMASLAMFLVLTGTFAWFAWTRSSPLFHLGSVAFLVAFLLTAGEYFFLRKVTGADFLSDGTTLAEKAERQAQSAVVLAQASAGAAMLLGICAIFAAVYAITGGADPWKAGFLAALWAAVGIVLHLRQRAESAKAEAELTQIRQLRADLEGSE